MKVTSIVSSRKSLRMKTSRLVAVALLLASAFPSIAQDQTSYVGQLYPELKQCRVIRRDNNIVDPEKVGVFFLAECDVKKVEERTIRVWLVRSDTWPKIRGEIILPWRRIKSDSEYGALPCFTWARGKTPHKVGDVIQTDAGVYVNLTTLKEWGGLNLPGHKDNEQWGGVRKEATLLYFAIGDDGTIRQTPSSEIAGCEDIELGE